MASLAHLSALPSLSWAAKFRFRQHMRQSLWAVPLVGTLVGLALARLDLWLEPKVDLPAAMDLLRQHREQPADRGGRARWSASWGLVVTVGVLVVQMATGTLSPRFMRLWYRDRLQKLVLAAFTATFAFSFALLREIGSGSVPDLGVTIAGVAVTRRPRPAAAVPRPLRARPAAGRGRRGDGQGRARGGRRRGARAARGPTSGARLARAPSRISRPRLPGQARSRPLTSGDWSGSRRPSSSASFRHTVGDFVTAGGAARRRLRPAPAGDAAPAPGHDRPRARADHRPGPRLRAAHHGRHRDPGALAGGQRPHHGDPDGQPHRGPAAGRSGLGPRVTGEPRSTPTARSGWSSGPAAGTTTWFSRSPRSARTARPPPRSAGGCEPCCWTSSPASFPSTSRPYGASCTSSTGPWTRRSRTRTTDARRESRTGRASAGRRRRRVTRAVVLDRSLLGAQAVQGPCQPPCSASSPSAAGGPQVPGS